MADVDAGGACLVCAAQNPGAVLATVLYGTLYSCALVLATLFVLRWSAARRAQRGGDEERATRHAATPLEPPRPASVRRSVPNHLVAAVSRRRAAPPAALATTTTTTTTTALHGADGELEPIRQRMVESAHAYAHALAERSGAAYATLFDGMTNYFKGFDALMCDVTPETKDRLAAVYDTCGSKLKASVAASVAAARAVRDQVAHDTMTLRPRQNGVVAPKRAVTFARAALDAPVASVANDGDVE